MCEIVMYVVCTYKSCAQNLKLHYLTETGGRLAKYMDMGCCYCELYAGGRVLFNTRTSFSIQSKVSGSQPSIKYATSDLHQIRSKFLMRHALLFFAQCPVHRKRTRYVWIDIGTKRH